MNAICKWVCLKTGQYILYSIPSNVLQTIFPTDHFQTPTYHYHCCLCIHILYTHTCHTHTYILYNSISMLYIYMNIYIHIAFYLHLSFVDDSPIISLISPSYQALGESRIIIHHQSFSPYVGVVPMSSLLFGGLNPKSLWFTISKRIIIIQNLI